MDPPSSNISQQDSQVRCIIYNNLLNVYVEKISDLQHVKEILNKFEILFGGDSSSSNGGLENRNKNKGKKNGLNKEENQPKGILPPRVNGATNQSDKLESEATVELDVHQENKSKEKNMVDLLLSYEFCGFDEFSW